MNNNRVTNREAAILYKFFSFNEPCSRSINSCEGKLRRRLSLQVPTITHAIDFLSKKGYDIKEEKLSEFLDKIAQKKLDEKEEEAKKSK